ncbi:DUF551 domain-containing protein [Serratia bockelmannii]
MTLTTEQLRARIGHLKERLRDMKQHKYPDNCPNASAYLEAIKAERQQDIELLEELLANREAQPVNGELGEIRVGRLPTMNQEEYPGLGDWWVQLRIGASGDEILARVYGATPDEAVARARALTAPPAPAVPDKATPGNIEILASGYSNGTFQLDDDEANLATEIWNACRAAMLAQPVSSGYKLPDGWIACSERMPASEGDTQTYVLAGDFKNHYWPNLPNTQVGVYGDWFNDGNPTWDDGDGNDLHLKEVTHWMPLPVAPEGGNDHDTGR